MFFFVLILCEFYRYFYCLPIFCSYDLLNFWIYRTIDTLKCLPIMSTCVICFTKRSYTKIQKKNHAQKLKNESRLVARAMRSFCKPKVLLFNQIQVCLFELFWRHLSFSRFDVCFLMIYQQLQFAFVCALSTILFSLQSYQFYQLLFIVLCKKAFTFFLPHFLINRSKNKNLLIWISSSNANAGIRD